MIHLFTAMLMAALATAALAQGAPPRSAPATRAAALMPGDQVRRLQVGGWNRSYVVHVPPRFDARRSTPVVLIFHGAGMNAGMMMRFCGMNAKADEAGFVAVYPNGTGIGQTALTFNAWEMPAIIARNQPDDVAFTGAVLDDLGTIMNVDAKRVYATGMSNGGFMCYRLAAEMSDRIAAIAPVAGTLGISRCNPKRPVSVIHFHGTSDAFVPFGGGDPKARRFLLFRSVDDTIATFVKLNGCPTEAKVTELADRTNDGTKVTRKVYGPGKDGAEVVLYTIEGGGHTWPGQPALERLLGKTTRDISANDLIWEFFERHPMKED